MGNFLSNLRNRLTSIVSPASSTRSIAASSDVNHETPGVDGNQPVEDSSDDIRAPGRRRVPKKAVENITPTETDDGEPKYTRPAICPRCACCDMRMADIRFNLSKEVHIRRCRNCGRRASFIVVKK